MMLNIYVCLYIYTLEEHQQYVCLHGGKVIYNIDMELLTMTNFIILF